MEQISALAMAARTSGAQRFAALPAAMDQFEQAEYRSKMADCTRRRVEGLRILDQRQAGAPAPGGQLHV